jgi:hypothetical protein
MKESRMWVLPNESIYGRWSEEDWNNYNLNQHKTIKLMWTICPVCGCLQNVIGNSENDEPRPIDISPCAEHCSNDYEWVNKGYDFIDTELHTMRVYEKEVNGLIYPVYEVIK